MDPALDLADSDLTTDELRERSLRFSQQANFYDKHFKHRSQQAVNFENKARVHARAILIRTLRNMELGGGQ